MFERVGGLIPGQRAEKWGRVRRFSGTGVCPPEKRGPERFEEGITGLSLYLLEKRPRGANRVPFRNGRLAGIDIRATDTVNSKSFLPSASVPIV